MYYDFKNIIIILNNYNLYYSSIGTTDKFRSGTKIQLPY